MLEIVIISKLAKRAIASPFDRWWINTITPMVAQSLSAAIMIPTILFYLASIHSRLTHNRLYNPTTTKILQLHLWAIHSTVSVWVRTVAETKQVAAVTKHQHFSIIKTFLIRSMRWKRLLKKRIAASKTLAGTNMPIPRKRDILPFQS